MKTLETFSAPVANQSEWRKHVIAAAIEKQESIIRDFKQRINDLLANEGNVNEEEYDNHLQSFKSEGLAEVNLLTDQMEFAQKELEELRKIDWHQDQPEETVHFGSIVETDQRVFFVSTSLEEFVVDGQDVFGLSVNAPLYSAMKGRRAGELFSFQSTQYHIKSIC